MHGTFGKIPEKLSRILGSQPLVDGREQYLSAISLDTSPSPQSRRMAKIFDLYLSLSFYQTMGTVRLKMVEKCSLDKPSHESCVLESFTFFSLEQVGNIFLSRQCPTHQYRLINCKQKIEIFLNSDL